MNSILLDISLVMVSKTFVSLSQTIRNGSLSKTDELPIFLNEINLIQTEVTSPLYWEVSNPSTNHSFPIASIRTDYNDINWNDNWTIFSKEEKETYLIGFKINKNFS